MDPLSDELSNLRQDYVEKVLPHLIPNMSKDVLASSGFNQSREFDINLHNDFIVGTPYDPETTKFVHFTSLRSLQSMLNDNAIRLYSLQNVNDPNEFDFYASDLDLGRKSFDQLKSNTFILSLCDAKVLNHENILNLWRFYGEGGRGVAIEFEIEMPRYSGVCKYFLGKVIYKESATEAFKIQNAEFEKRHDVKVDFSEVIRVPACFHKSPYYKAEEEVRLMLISDHAELEAKYDFKQNRFRRDFNSRNEPVTYHRLEFGQKNSLHLPMITIKRIELGFKHSKNFFIDFAVHLTDTFASMGKAGIWKDGLPKIDPSDLGNIYR